MKPRGPTVELVWSPDACSECGAELGGGCSATCGRSRCRWARWVRIQRLRRLAIWAETFRRRPVPTLVDFRA